MQYITYKQIQKKIEDAKTVAYKQKLSTIWRLATENQKLNRVSLKRWRLAKSLREAIELEWSAKDRVLELESREYTCDSARAKRANEFDDKMIERCQSLAKPLSLRIMLGTWAHVFAGNDQIL